MRESAVRRLLRSSGRGYLLEAVVCFGSLVVLIGLGVLMLPMAFANEADKPFAWLLTLLLLGGLCGLWALIQLVSKVVVPTREVASPRAIVIMLLLGVASLLTFYSHWTLSPAANLMLVVLPLIGSAHELHELAHSIVLKDSL